jgi:uncharacterized integral membrane protein
VSPPQRLLRRTRRPYSSPGEHVDQRARCPCSSPLYRTALTTGITVVMSTVVLSSAPEVLLEMSKDMWVAGIVTFLLLFLLLIIVVNILMICCKYIFGMGTVVYLSKLLLAIVVNS